MNTSRLLLALLALTTGAFAQDKNAAAPADAAKLALAHEAIAATRADKMIDNMSGQMKQLAARLSPAAPTATPEERKQAEELQGKILDLSLAEAKGLIAKMDAIYASVFSEAELKAMIAFYNSPEGQSMIGKQPQIMAQLMPAIQDMQSKLMPKIQQLVEESRAAAVPK